MRIAPDPESGTVQVAGEGPRGCFGGGDDPPQRRRPFGATVTNKVGDLAEEEGHHPKLTTEWGSVVVTCVECHPMSKEAPAERDAARSRWLAPTSTSRS